MRYKILWIDDDYKTQEDFISFAEQLKIDITPFESHEEGMSSLETKSYHAVILDAKVKKGKEDTTTGVAGLAASRDRLIEINKDMYLPYFIFTGQPDYMKDEMFVQSYGEFYIKGDDNEKLITDIISACEKHSEIQARKSYPEAFLVFDKGIIDKSYEHLLIEIITAYENQDYRKKNLTVQRDFFEAIFISLRNPIPCIPPSLFYDNGKPYIGFCTTFMEDRITRDRYNTEQRLNKIVPNDIKASFRKIKESTNQYSHLAEETKLKLPFISNTFLLMEVLEWLPNFVKTNYPNYI